ncbi:MAG: ATP-binding protein, partial [Acidimicrobiales bacterium]
AEAERRSLERRLNQSQRLESLGQLAGGVAHDFNNLLAVIMNYATFVGEETAGDPAVHADVEQIKEAADRAARLTRQLLIFARRETVEREVLALNGVVADIHKLLARSLGEHVEVVLRPGTDLPAIRADRGQVEQVLVNLAVNARDAMAGGGTLTIETTATDIDAIFAEAHPGLRAGSYVELVVSDTGAGMSPDVASRVFEPFFTTKGKGEGTGLGLATVYGIVTEAGGSVSVYSEEGIGTTFRAYFPAVDAAVGAAEAPAVAEAGAGRGETILVVEDDPGVLHMTSRILRENGYEVLEADGFAMAMELAATHEFQMLLTDSVMPHSSGGSLAELITAEHPGLPVLYMSGYGDGVLGPTRVIPDDAQLLRKPFTRRMLLEKVRALSATAPPRGHD